MPFVNTGRGVSLWFRLPPRSNAPTPAQLEFIAKADHPNGLLPFDRACPAPCDPQDDRGTRCPAPGNELAGLWPRAQNAAARPHFNVTGA
jgi:hypothetical protein